MSDAQIAALQAGRQRIADQKLKDREARDAEIRNDLLLKESDPDGWLAIKKAQYSDLCSKIVSLNRQEKGSRRRAAGTSRLRVVSKDLLSENDGGFGVKDEDWDVYRMASKEVVDKEVSTAMEAAFEVEAEIRSLDSSFETHRCLGVSNLGGAYALSFAYDPEVCGLQRTETWDQQLHLGPEKIFCSELLFKPWLNRYDSSGLMEVLGNYRGTAHSELLSRVIVTGGGSNFPNLAERLQSELRLIVPMEKEVSVLVDGNPLNSWNGLSHLAASGQASWFSRAEYYESGVYGILRHQDRYSNHYYGV
ncbi:hypothetical protein GEMRC1_014192 [Eukaryota sp. GEM-RC1]